MFKPSKRTGKRTGRRTGKRTGARPGFSMIELLVVMFLIAFMVAFLTKVFIDGTRNAKIRATRVLLHKLDIALHEYFADFGEYPPDSGYGMPVDGGKKNNATQYDAGSLYRYLGRQLVVTSGPKKGNYGPYIAHFTDKELQQFQGPETTNNFMVVDPWNTPVGYIGSRSRVIHNRDGVDLFSAGPDRKTASDTDSGKHDPYPEGCDHSNIAYDGTPTNANAVGLGHAVFNGALTAYKKVKNITGSSKSQNEVLDDVNNWDPEN